MVGVKARGSSRILTNRWHEDYKSLKQEFKHSSIKEILFEGWQITAGAVAEVLSGERAISRIAAKGVVYVKALADLPAYDGKAIYVEYLDDAGLIKGPITSLLDIAGGVGTETEHALGNENVIDTVASGQGTTTVTMTALDPGLDGYNGLYMVVYSGNQKGEVHLITATTADSPTVLTVDPAGGAALDADLVQIQEFPCDDFFRLRRMWAEKESPEDNAQELCNHDGTVWYGEISDWNSRAALSAYFAPAATECKSFLGKVHINGPVINEGDTIIAGYIIQITFTPKAIDANETPSDVTLTFWFNGDFNWEPCIELEPATDVIFEIGDLGTASNLLVETAFLEIGH